MQGCLIVICDGCNREMRKKIAFDTADLPELLSEKGRYAQKILLDHRDECPYYGKKEEVKSDNRD